jgi:hypothetical protein
MAKKNVPNKDKHAYTLLSGRQLSLGWLDEMDMQYLEGLAEKAKAGEDYFELLKLVRGHGAYPRDGGSLTPEVAQSLVFQVATDIVERAGIEQGLSIHPQDLFDIPQETPLVSIAQAAEIIGFSKAATHQALMKGKLRGWLVGNYWVLDRSSVERFRDARAA